MPAPDFTALTNEIIAAVEAKPGAPELPWRRSNLHLPRNALTKNCYRGVNVISLWASATRPSFSLPIWASYRQWEAIGAQVRRGEKGTSIIYYQAARSDSEAEDLDQPRRPLARSSVVFSAEQVSGYQPPAAPPPSVPSERFARADQFIQATGADIRHGGDEAYYAPGGDYIQLPNVETFIATQTSSAKKDTTPLPFMSWGTGPAPSPASLAIWLGASGRRATRSKS